MPSRKTSIEQSMTVAQHRDHFRGRCALALDWNAKITLQLANAICISPMEGCTDLGAIEGCRRYIVKMTERLDQAEESARAVRAAESEVLMDLRESGGRCR